jgi:hypothetical protein
MENPSASKYHLLIIWPVTSMLINYYFNLMPDSKTDKTETKILSKT